MHPLPRMRHPLFRLLTILAACALVTAASAAPKEVSKDGVIHVMKGVGGVLVDGRLAGSGHGIRARTGMQHAGFETHVARGLVTIVRHDIFTLGRRLEITPELKPPQDSSA